MDKLPTVKKRKLIDPVKMEKLARRVKKILIEEDKYVMEQRTKNGNNSFPRIYPNS